MVVVIWARNNSASGNVASDLWPAKARPTIAEEASRVEVPVMSAAWLSDKSNTLRFIYPISQLIHLEKLAYSWLQIVFYSRNNLSFDAAVDELLYASHFFLFNSNRLPAPKQTPDAIMNLQYFKLLKIRVLLA